MFKGQEVKEKQFDNLCESTEASFEKTVTDRYWRIMSFIMEVKTVIEDCSANSVPGLSAGLHLATWSDSCPAE